MSASLLIAPMWRNVFHVIKFRNSEKIKTKVIKLFTFVFNQILRSWRQRRWVNIWRNLYSREHSWILQNIQSPKTRFLAHTYGGMFRSKWHMVIPNSSIFHITFIFLLKLFMKVLLNVYSIRFIHNKWFPVMSNT